MDSCHLFFNGHGGPGFLMQTRLRVAIVGGGISGLAAAYELASQHLDVAFTLYEASGRLGGIVETVHEKGFTIECGPDSWVTEKPWARELAEELGLASEIIPSNDHQRRTYLVQHNKLVPMPDGMRMMVPYRWEPLLHSPLLSWQARLAYLRESKRAEELKEFALLLRGENADESVAEFVIRHFGEEATRLLAGPLLAGVFGGDIDKLSVRSVMLPFVKMERETGSLILAVRERATQSTNPPAIFTTLKNGLGVLIKHLAAALPPASIHLHTAVTALTPAASKWLLSANSGKAEQYDSVLLATPAHVTRSLLASIHDPSANEIANLLPAESSSAIVVAMGYLPETAARLRIPRGFGFLVPENNSSLERQSRLLAGTFVDQKFNHRAPAGAALLRGFFGGTAAETLRNTEDSAIILEARQQLSSLLGPLPEPDVAIVRHWPLSLPQYFVGHAARIAALEQKLHKFSGLSLLGSAYRGVGLPDLVRQARLTVKSLVSLTTEEVVP